MSNNTRQAIVMRALTDSKNKKENHKRDKEQN